MGRVKPVAWGHSPNYGLSSWGHHYIVSHNITHVNKPRDLLCFLSPLDTESKHVVIQGDLVGGTGEWLLRSEEFRRWQAGTGSHVLCLMGEPGAGKTFLMCRVVEALRSDITHTNDSAVCFIYCDYQNRERFTARNIIGALLSQMVPFLGHESDFVRMLKVRNETTRLLSLEEAKDFFCRAVASGSFKTTWVCFDALDELDSEEIHALLRCCREICQVPTVRIFMTGRSNAGVENVVDDLLGGFGTPIHYLPISPDGVRRDLRTFLEQKLLEDGNSELMDDELFERVAEPGSNFMLTSLDVKDTLRKRTLYGRKKVSNSQAPAPSVHAAYEAMIMRIQGWKETYGIKILHWILFARRPLTVQELQNAIAIEPDSQDFDPEQDLSLFSILHSTSGLITVARENGSVAFFHETFKEYLLVHSSVYFPTGHALLGETALAYLNLTSMTGERGRTRYSEGGDLYPFLSYAIQNWGYHVHQCEDDRVTEKALHFMLSAGFLNVRKVAHHSPYYSPLHLASHFGLAKIMFQLLSSEVDVNSTNEHGRTALSYAAEGGHLKAIRILLEQRDVNVNAVDNNSRTPLSYAAQGGHSEALQMLLERSDVDVNAVDNNSRTPLSYATETGSPEVVNLFLQREEIDTNLPDMEGRTPFSYAAGNGRSEAVQLFLRNNSDADIPNKSGRTPLSYASERGHIVTVMLLLELKRVKADSVDDSGRTPLSYAAGNGNFEVAKILLQRKDVDVNSGGNDSRTPLSYASEGGHIATVKLLLESKRIKVDFADESGRTPLSYAVRNGSVDVVKLLIQRNDVDVNFAANDRRTPLFYAAEGGHSATVKLLLDLQHIKADSADDSGRTPLSYVAENGHVEATKLLLERKDVDVNSIDNKKRTPLLYAVQNERLEIARMLLQHEDISLNPTGEDASNLLIVAAGIEQPTITQLLLDSRGIDVNSVDKRCCTPLACAAINGHSRVVEVLLRQKEIDANLPDSEKMTPLAHSAKHGATRIVELLLQHRHDNLTPIDKRANLNSIDAHGNFPLWYAVCYQHASIIELLLGEEDIDVNMSNADGDTVLSYASQHGYHEIVEQLLQRGRIDVNTVNGDKRTPLLCAIGRGNHNVIEPLQQDGIKLNVTNKYGRTPLFHAVEGGYIEIVRLLIGQETVDLNLADERGDTPLLCSVKNPRLEVRIVELLLRQDKIDVNLKDEVGDTALSYAARNALHEVVRLLVSRADIDKHSAYSRTPLSYAAQMGHVDIMKLLLEKEDTKTNTSNQHLTRPIIPTPLTYAALRGNYEAVTLLLVKANSDVNSSDKRGRTPLSYAAQNGHLIIVNILLQQEGINVNLAGHNGRTPLSYAAGSGHLDTVRCILQRQDVDKSLADKQGRTPSYYAKENGDVEVIKLLHGATCPGSEPDDTLLSGHHDVVQLQHAGVHSHELGLSFSIAGRNPSRHRSIFKTQHLVSRA